MMLATLYSHLGDFERHRPIYHITPAKGHSNDPNGLFYDPVHDRYHLWVQWNEYVLGGGKSGWYHFVSSDLVKWERLGLDPAHNISGCSGGATRAPDGTPTLIFCSGQTAVPINRSDPLLRQWRVNGTDFTRAAYNPRDTTGKWDGSVSRDALGRYVVTFGSCKTANHTQRPAPRQCGTPQILSYRSSDLRTWEYLGEQWSFPSGQWPVPAPYQPFHPAPFDVVRTECPYVWDDGDRTLVKLSMPGFGRDYVFVGGMTGNGSHFVPSSAGTILDWGEFYAAAVLEDTSRARHLLWGWVLSLYNITATTGAQFDGALSLPRVMDFATGALPRWEIAPEIAALRSGPPTVLIRLTVPPHTAVPLRLPRDASGDAVEIMMNMSHASVLAAPLGLMVRSARHAASSQSRCTLTRLANGLPASREAVCNCPLAPSART